MRSFPSAWRRWTPSSALLMAARDLQYLVDKRIGSKVIT